MHVPGGSAIGLPTVCSGVRCTMGSLRYQIWACDVTPGGLPSPPRGVDGIACDAGHVCARSGTRTNPAGQYGAEVMHAHWVA